MADSKISALTAVASVDGTEEIPVNESGTTKKATGAQVAAYQETRLQQGVRASHSADQTLTTGTWTELAWDTETWKVGEAAIHSTSTNNGRMTAQIAGEYLVTGVVQWEAVAADFSVQARIRLNGSSNESRINVPNSNDGTSGTMLQFSMIVQLSASDYVTIEAQHTRGSDLDVLSTHTRLAVYLLGR